MMRKSFWVFVTILCLCVKASAQNDVTAFIKKVGALIDTMSVRGVDRRYIDAPEKPWQLIVKGNVNQSSLKMKAKGTIADILEYSATPYLKTEPSQYIGLWAGYRGYGLGYTVNVGGDKGSYLTFGATGGAYGVNVRIHSFNNDHPSFEFSSNLFPDEIEDDGNDMLLIDPIKVHTLIADGYYLFNGKHFSYAAAYGYATNAEDLLDDPIMQNESDNEAWKEWYYKQPSYNAYGQEDVQQRRDR